MSGAKQLTETKIDYYPVLKIMGYDPPDRSPARIQSLVANYMKKSSRWISPTYNYTIKEVLEVSDNISRIEGDIVFQGGVIARLLEGCEKVAIFSLTIGSAIEKLSASMAEYGWVLKASVLDAVASVMAEKLADEEHSRIAAKALTQGLAVSRRFSPGYCDWHVSQQKMVFKALGQHTAGVKLTPSNLMIPRKSMSGIIGLGPFGLADKYAPCLTCERNQECPWRRI